MQGYVLSEPFTLDPKQRGVWVQVQRENLSPEFELRMVPSAVITGRAIDTAGRVIPGTSSSVHLSILGYDDYGERGLDRGVGRTVFKTMDDRGEYRFFDLQPGDYYVHIVDSTSVDSGIVIRGGIYPGVDDISRATAIHVEAGQEVQLKTMVLRREQTAPVHLRLLNSPVERTITTVTYGSIAFIFPVMPGTLQPPDHRITLPAISSGEHEFWITVVSKAGPLVGSANINLPGAEIEADVTLEAALKIHSRIVLVDPAGQSTVLKNSRCSIRPVPLKAILGVNSCVDAHGVPGFYRLEFEDFPTNAYVASATAGGRDILRDGIELKKDTDLDVVLATPGAVIEGIATNSRDATVTNAVVALVPDAPFRAAGPLYRAVVTDIAGRFELTGIAPGDYHLFAWTRLVGAAYKNPEFLKGYEDQGKALSLTKGSRLSVNITVSEGLASSPK